MPGPANRSRHAAAASARRRAGGAEARTLPGCETAIERLGTDGDGVGRAPDGAPLYVAGTLPGEVVRATELRRRGGAWVADAAAILRASPARVAPPCPLFGRCGGCRLQHWDDAAYADWKTARLADALARAGYPGAPLGPLARTPPGSRRRMDLALRRVGEAVTLGLHERRGGRIVDLVGCRILHPALLALLPPLRSLLAGLACLSREGSAILNLLDDGADLLLRTDAALTAGDRAALAGFAASHGLPRIAWALRDDTPETASLLRAPAVRFGALHVTPPPGAFLQPSAEGEASIAAAVLDGLPDRPARPRVVELYAGSGTLTGRLAGRARVVAYEGDAAAAAALRAAAGGHGIEVARRDLARQPVRAAELAGAGAVVLDPPYGGAAAQVAEIALARPARVIYVSCNPAALARDAWTLRGAGYALLAATPVDQFLWSAELESVLVFARDGKA